MLRHETVKREPVGGVASWIPSSAELDRLQEYAWKLLSVLVKLPRVDVLGVHVSAVSMTQAVTEVLRWVTEREPHYVCVTGVHGVMESQRSEELRLIHNEAGLSTPDGMPMVWCCHRAGVADTTRVYGPDLMLELCAHAAERGWRSFFYGGRPGVPELLAAKLQERFPGLEVVGCYSPPFRPLEGAERDELVDRINGSGADFVWVGLSTPKQERWMAEMRPRLEAPVLLGVGAAFDIHAGLLRQAPPTLQRLGLEWAFRLAVEPRRLWRRYLSNNPRFVAALLRRPPELVPAASAERTPTPTPTVAEPVLEGA